MDAPTFREDFPEFADSTKYPDPLVNIWLTVSVSLCNPERWGQLTDVAVGLCLAHHLVVSTRDTNAANAGLVPGEVKGPPTAKSVDKVSGSYDSSAVSNEDAAIWNRSRYGVQFMQMARYAGAGGIQL